MCRFVENVPGRVLKFSEQMEESPHWAVKAFGTKEGKKITQAMVENARKRESNAKLLEEIETAIREKLGSKSEEQGVVCDVVRLG